MIRRNITTSRGVGRERFGRDESRFPIVGPTL